MQTRTVELKHCSYPIYIGENLLENSSLLQQHIKGRQILIVSHPQIAELYLNNILPHLSQYQVDIVLLPYGEQHKTLAQVESIFTQLIENKHHRSTSLIALGGGVIGDMTGFAAACYQRGVNYIQIPTTLLAQVDAAIGGKTAVNHKLGKNMIGAFHQPQCVIADVKTLISLDQREFNAGLAEIIKAALINDAAFFSWLEENISRLFNKDSAALIHAITQACTIKAKLVIEDELDLHGIRALLNLGHTFGHALEQMTEYQTYLHGEAVAIGIVLAAQFSTQTQGLSLTDFQRIKQLLQTANLPTHLSKEIDRQNLLSAMLRDKKMSNDNLNLILLKKIGEAVQVQNVPSAAIEQMLQS